VILQKTAKGKQAKVTKKFIIDATQPASDKIFDVAAFEKFLQEKIKVDGRTGNLGDIVQISQAGEGKIEVVAHTEFSGRYLKYLYVAPPYPGSSRTQH
jgi:large subunit ribosomal protein L22e